MFTPFSFFLNIILQYLHLERKKSRHHQSMDLSLLVLCDKNNEMVLVHVR